MDPLKMYFLLKILIFHRYVSLPEGNWNLSLKQEFDNWKHLFFSQLFGEGK